MDLIHHTDEVMEEFNTSIAPPTCTNCSCIVDHECRIGYCAQWYSDYLEQWDNYFTYKVRDLVS